jgi:hypothetical protein
MLTYRIFANPRTRNGDILALEKHVKLGHTVIDVGANAAPSALLPLPSLAPLAESSPLNHRPNLPTLLLEISNSISWNQL